MSEGSPTTIGSSFVSVVEATMMISCCSSTCMYHHRPLLRSVSFFRICRKCSSARARHAQLGTGVRPKLELRMLFECCHPVTASVGSTNSTPDAYSGQNHDPSSEKVAEYAQTDQIQDSDGNPVGGWTDSPALHMRRSNDPPSLLVSNLHTDHHGIYRLEL